MLDRLLKTYTAAVAITTLGLLLTSAITVAEMHQRITDINQRIDAITLDSETSYG